jgi:hypothetical protein
MTRYNHRSLRLALAILVAALSFAGITGVAQAAFGVKKFSGSLLTLEGQTGSPQLTAGAHPDFTTTFELTTKHVEGRYFPNAEVPDGNVREIIGYGPPGLVGNTTVVPPCALTELAGIGYAPECLPQSQVGRLDAVMYTAGSRFAQGFPVYRMVAPPGVPAEFGVNVSGVLVLIEAQVVNRGGSYSIALVSHQISEGLPIGGMVLTLWGVPAAKSHDSIRSPKLGEARGPEGVPSSAAKLPMMRNPTSCTGRALEFTGHAESWQGEAATATPFDSDESGRPLLVEGCGNVPFEASFSAQPTTQAASSPTGLVTTIRIPQTSTPNGIATSDLRDAVIDLPAGLTVNPASAGDLASCSSARIHLDDETPAECPNGSKLGIVTIDTPVLETPLEGSVYLAAQKDNEFGSLMALYLTFHDPTTGVVLKLPGKVETGPDGRLTVSFTENPQLPFETLKLEMFGGSRAALMTPSECGTYRSTATFIPWSGTAPVSDASTFEITSGPGGTPCPTGSFAPKFRAGTTNPVAGADSPFILDVARADGSSLLGSISASLPKGLLAKLAGVPYCPDSALAGISGAEGTAAAQVRSPSCPSRSRVGSVAVTAGAGSSPFTLRTGAVYLAGPYKGAPLSLAIVTPALAGPFDLGNVMVRTALRVDPETVQVTAVSDPLPTILHGIPLDLRDVLVDVDASEFTRNPTSCEPTAVTSTISSVAGALATPQSRFQVSGCASLGLTPRLALRFSGAPTRRGGHPKLTATLTTKSGDANLRRVQVTLPKTEYLENAHIRTVCTRVQYAAKQCPEKSIYGYARAWTPLLDKPLEGPVYLRSSDHKLPDLVASLDGQIHIDLDGRINSFHSRIRNTFDLVPDAPVSKFVLTMRGGGKGLLVNNTNVCRAKPRASVEFNGQNGKVERTSPLVKVGGCGHKKNRKSHKAHTGKRQH